MASSQLSRPLPSHQTKHLHLLKYPLWPSIERRIPGGGSQQVISLTQSNACVTSTGSTLWLGSQILSAYLLTKSSSGLPRSKNRKLRAVEIGAGTGLVSITLSALGYCVLTTDIEPSLSQILLPNVKTWMAENPSSGRIAVGNLDWNLSLDWQSIDRILLNCEAEDGTFDINQSVGPYEITCPSEKESTALAVDIDLIVSADTVYTPHLIRPLLTTLETLSDRSARPPSILISLERREPTLIDGFFKMAIEMGFRATQIEMSRLNKITGAMGWQTEDWEGVELWKLLKKRKTRTKN